MISNLVCIQIIRMILTSIVSHRRSNRLAVLRSMPSAECQQVLNSWCNGNCPHFQSSGSLTAMLGASANGPQAAWRCYADSSLDAQRQHYATGTTYCTRDGPLRELLQRCESRERSTLAYTINGAGVSQRVKSPPSDLQEEQKRQQLDEAAAYRLAGQRAQAQQRKHEQPQGIWMPVRTAARPLDQSPPPTYAHEKRLLMLPPTVHVPRFDECEASVASNAQFWAISLYSAAYTEKAYRLIASCERVGVCCKPSFVPDGAFTDLKTGATLVEGSNPWRHRLIASKPVFMLESLRQSPLPIVWLDVDLEFHQFPSLFLGSSWSSPRDVLLWNWQANVTAFQGRRLKMASGVGYYNKTPRAEALLLAWAQAQAYEHNAAAPDDQTLDLLVNEDRWIDRVEFGWLPEVYLRMPRHAHLAPVIDHDRGNPVSQRGRNSPVVPVLPPHVA